MHRRRPPPLNGHRTNVLSPRCRWNHPGPDQLTGRYDAQKSSPVPSVRLRRHRRPAGQCRAARRLGATGAPRRAPRRATRPGQADPPARVGRIASQSGAVSFRTSADTQWSAASPNYPVSEGNAFWTEPTARAELEISASRIDLSGQTEFDVTTLADSGLQAVVPQGELYLHLADLAPNEVWTVQTPRGTVRMTAAGRYDIVAGTTEQPTQITVLDGAAEIEGPGVSLTLGAKQTATLTGTGPFQNSVGPEVTDAFFAARLAAEHPPTPPPAPLAAQLAYMPGAEDLSGYGEWSQAPDYGDVWYPSVPANWVPYREGEWAYVAPWGWTWMDSDPWGFAPFHYGRWAHIGNRWGWLPGEERAERPVYAPALVAFLGVAAGVAVGAAIAHGTIGWVPLGPREAYHPWYHASRNYIQRINTGHVRDLAGINNNVAIGAFANRGAATAVPASVLLGSRPVRAAARPLSAQAFAAARPVIGQQPIHPAVTTFGVTPAVARQLNLQGGGRGFAPRPPAPGPAIHVQEPGAGNGFPSRPALIGPRGAAAGGPRPGEPAVVRPGGPPPLPEPGTRPAGMAEPNRPRPPGEIAGPEAPAGVRPEGTGRPVTGPEMTRPGVLHRCRSLARGPPAFRSTMQRRRGHLPPAHLPPGRVRPGRLPLGRLPLGRLPSGRVRAGRLPLGRLPLGRLPPGRVRPKVARKGSRVRCRHRGPSTTHPSSSARRPSRTRLSERRLSTKRRRASWRRNRRGPRHRPG